jgi:nucleoid-associated protein YgaU
MPTPSEDFISQSADLARERLLGRVRRAEAADQSGEQAAAAPPPRRSLHFLGLTMAVALATLTVVVALPHLSGPSAQQQAALRAAQRELAEMRGKLDQWMVAAAQREEGVRAELAHRDAEIEALGQALVADDLAAAVGADMANRLAALEASRDELARSLAETRQALSDTKAAHARDLAQAEAQREARGSLEQELASRRQVLESQMRSNAELSERLSALEQTLAMRDSRLRELEQQLAVATAPKAEDLETVRAAASQAARRLSALRSKPTGDPANRAALERLREEATVALFEQQARLATLSGGAGLYTVREFDTLSGIASRILGGSERWPELFEANHHILESADWIAPGLPLVLPATMANQRTAHPAAAG